MFVGRWAGFGALGTQINALGYQAGAYSDGGYDTNTTTADRRDHQFANRQRRGHQRGRVAAPGTLGYANGTLFFRIDQEIIQGHYIDGTHISLDVRGANASTAASHSANAPVLRFLPTAQNNYVGTEAGKYLWGGNNDLHGHQAGYQGSFHDSTGGGYHALYVAVGLQQRRHWQPRQRRDRGPRQHRGRRECYHAGLGTPFSVTTGPETAPGHRQRHRAAEPEHPIPAGTGAANGWSSGQTVNLMWSWPGTYAPVHLESTNTSYLFTYYKNATTNSEYLLPSKQVWYWNGSAVNDANPGDNNPPVGGNDVASWPSPENSSVTLYQPVGTATFTPIVAVNEATAIGSAATATAQNAVAVGANANADQLNALAMGQAAAATGDHASAIGTNAAASASYAQAIGYAASVSGGDLVALGANATVSSSRKRRHRQERLRHRRRFPLRSARARRRQHWTALPSAKARARATPIQLRSATRQRQRAAIRSCSATARSRISTRL